jgi:hypothetical protein
LFIDRHFWFTDVVWWQPKIGRFLPSNNSIYSWRPMLEHREIYGLVVAQKIVLNFLGYFLRGMQNDG